jgi:hypothetical protein
MKKHYLILGVTLLVGLQVLFGHAEILKQSVEQITLPKIIAEQVNEKQGNNEQASEGQQQDITFSPIELSALIPQKCWSARKCKGKVLNNLNAHECKNSGGKSWNDNQGVCYKL